MGVGVNEMRIVETDAEALLEGKQMRQREAI